MSEAGPFFTGMLLGALLAFGCNETLMRDVDNASNRACVAALSAMATEADTLRYVLVDGHDECKHWVLNDD